MIRKLERIFDEQIRPSLAAHGGGADIVDVDGGRVYLRLRGGCQGCAASSATLKDGIERLVRRNFPEIEEVVDLTDHAAGTDPWIARDPGDGGGGP